MPDEAITNPAAPAPPWTDGAAPEQPPAPAPAADGAITPQAPVAFAPVTPGERLANLDFARGLALLGILFVNAASFFGPMVALTPAGYARYTGADRTAALLVQSLFTSKFISIFSMLFGYGLLGQIERAAARGGSPVWFTLRRLGALALFGAAHALVLWYGDILFIYALIGVWMLVARYLGARWLIVIAVALLLFATALRGGALILQAHFGGLDRPPAAAPTKGPPLRGFEAILKAQFNPTSPVWLEAETAAYRDGPLADALTFRIVQWAFVLISTVVFAGWQVLGMFFLGAALFRLRFFDPDRAGLRRRVLLIALPLGAALEGAAAYFYWAHSPTDGLAWGVAGVLQQAALIFLPVGYLALFALTADALPALARSPVCNAGRMSLTVYLGETLLATALSYWWGLRWFGQFGPAAQAGLTVLIWLALVAFATLWLSIFSQGPMEWLWRRLAYSRRPAPPQTAG